MKSLKATSLRGEASRSRRFGPRKSALLAGLALAFSTSTASAQQYWNTDGASANITAANWGSAPDGPGGFFTNAYLANTEMVFGADSLITNVTNTNVGDMTVNGAFNVLWTSAGTMPTNGTVRTLNVAAGGVLDLANQSISTAAGTGFIKSGDGILFSSNGNQYPGGFTLNAGTVIVGSINAMGAGGVLTINGGTIAANATRNLNGKYTNIVVGGNFTLGGTTTGVTTANAIATANLTFNDTMSLGAATRTITIGGSGVYTLGGTISGAAGTGLTIGTASTGSIVLTGANNYTGPTTINSGATLQIGNGGATGSLSPSSTITNNGTLTINRTGTITQGTDFANAIGGNGALTKASSGTLVLGGTNTYAGATTISGGTLDVTGSLTGTSNINVTAGTTFQSSGTVSATGNLVLTGTATLLAKTGATITVGGGVNTSGAVGSSITIEPGATVNAASSNISWNPAAFVVNGSYNLTNAFNVSTNNTTTLTGNGTVSAASGGIFNANTNFIVDKSGGSVSYTNLLTLGSGTAGNSGTLTLAATNTGTVNAGGIRLGTATTTAAQTVSLNGGRLNLGSSGISTLGTGPRVLNFNDATVGASADWSNALDITLGGTAAGTTFNTLDSVDNTTPRSITLSGILGGTGKLVKESAGTLTLSNTGNQLYADTTTVNGGSLVVAGTLANNGPASIFMAAPNAPIGNNPTLTRAISAGLNTYAGFGSTVTDASLDPVLAAPLQTQAEILMSGNNAAPNDMSMEWRTRTTFEAAPSNTNAVLSDVLSLTGMGSDIFVLQMSYTDAVIANMNLNENSIAVSGELRLGWKDGADWTTAVDGNSGGTSTFAGDISWNTYYTALSAFDDGSDLNDFLGVYGVDSANNVVWAVLNHNSEFAVIPEPSTLVLGGLALLGFAGAGLRRRQVK